MMSNLTLPRLLKSKEVCASRTFHREVVRDQTSDSLLRPKLLALCVFVCRVMKKNLVDDHLSIVLVLGDIPGIVPGT
jgi:hypothetical protein